MTITDPVEILYLSLMLRWEKSAPPDGRQGLLDDEPERNTQISRMAYILKKVAAGTVDRTFNSLSRSARRNDGHSYVSKDKSRMTQPVALFDGWYFEGCTNLKQKHGILQGLTKLGLSSLFVACADDFVTGKSVQQYMPSEQEQDEILKHLETA